jgi:hypothetical protein
MSNAEHRAGERFYREWIDSLLIHRFHVQT